MHSGKTPFQTQFLTAPYALSEYTDKDTRHLSDMQDYFADETARSAAAKAANPLVYTVYRQEVPHEAGQLLHCITIIEPGQVAGEYFMTKGHYHQDESCGEIYYGQAGHGLLVLQRGQESQTLEMKAGTICYIPPGWGHRTVNIGAEEFVFFSVWPGNSGYDYERALREPFTVKIQAANGSYQALPK